MFVSKPPKGSRLETEQEVEHLDAIARASLERKQRLYDRMGVAAGSRVLDVGCGAGADTVPLGLRVGPSGRVVGLDVDDRVIAEADRRAAEAGAGGWVEHRVADATEIPFPDGFFDACHSERVFMHLRRPEQVFAEMVRVTRPGGVLLVIDWDHATLSIDTPETGIERRISPYWAKKQKNPCAGRRLLQLFRRHALEDVGFDVHAVLLGDLRRARYFLKLDDLEARACQEGAVTEEEVLRFRASLEELEALNATYIVANQVTVVGRKT